MSRRDVNRSGEMEVFVRVVEAGGFAPAARICRMTPSAVSKLVTRLEARLGARLFNRSTRRLHLTPEGSTFYERARRILADIEDAERRVGAGEEPVGPIRVNTSASYATHVLVPALPQFLANHPRVTIDLVQTDVVIDLFAERADVAVRAGPLKSSSLVARGLGDAARIVVAAPSYLARYGQPSSVAELEALCRLGPSYVRAEEGWPFEENGRVELLPISGQVQASDGEALRQLALAGVGVARLPVFTVRNDIAAGRLVPLLEHLNPGDTEPFHAIYVGQGGPLPSRVRALLDFLAEYGRVA